MAVTAADDLRRPVTLDEAADLVQVSPSTVRRWVATGLLAAVWWRGRWYAAEVDVLDADHHQRVKARRRPGGDRRATPVPVVVDSRAMHISYS